MNYRIITILVITFSILYGVASITLLHILPKEALRDFPEKSGGKEVKHFLIVSQILRFISCVFLLKLVSPSAERNRAYRNMIFPFLIWNVIAVFICAVVIIHSIIKSVTSPTAIGFAVFLGIGTSMMAFFVVLMCLYYKELLNPFRSRGPSTVAILSNGTKERTKSFLAEKEIL